MLNKPDTLLRSFSASSLLFLPPKKQPRLLTSQMCGEQRGLAFLGADSRFYSANNSTTYIRFPFVGNYDFFACCILEMIFPKMNKVDTCHLFT